MLIGVRNKVRVIYKYFCDLSDIVNWVYLSSIVYCMYIQF